MAHKSHPELDDLFLVDSDRWRRGSGIDFVEEGDVCRWLKAVSGGELAGHIDAYLEIVSCKNRCDHTSHHLANGTAGISHWEVNHMLHRDS